MPTDSIIKLLNSTPKARRAGRPLMPVVIQRDPDRKLWWLMRDSPDRFSHYSWCYTDIFKLMESWDIEVTEYAEDENGSFYRARSKTETKS